MSFPYGHYQTLAEPVRIYYPAGHETLAHQVLQWVDEANRLLAGLLALPTPEMEILLIAPEDWQNAPRDEPEETFIMLPYLTEATQPSALIVPTELDPIVGRSSQEKLAFLLFHEVAHAFLASD